MIAILVASLSLQFVAAVLALRLVRKTSSAWGWIVIAAALVLMSSRRAVTLGKLITSHEIRVDGTAELIALAISILMVTGVALIGSVFERLHRAERVVRRSEREMREMLDATPDGIVLVHEGAWVYANPTAVRLLALDPGAPQNDRALVASFPATDQPRLANGPLAANAGRGLALELVLAERDPPSTIELVAGPSIEYAGHPARLLVVRDLTERKAIEAQLLQSQKLEALGRMAGGIAHDFNNLLTVVLTSTVLVKQQLPDDHPAVEPLGYVEQAAERGAALTAQLLAFSRHGTGKIEVIDLGVLISSLRTLLGALAGSSIEIESSHAPDVHRISGDRSQIEQVLANLVVNARDAMPEGGTISLTTRTAQIEAGTASPPWSDTPAGAYVVLAVADTGVGMTEEIKAKIFDPFYTTKPEGKGSGLGLATCYAIARRLHGGITVSTAPGKGSTFEVWLPATNGAVPTAAPAPTTVAASVPLAILLAEDEPVIRSIGARILRSEGYEVVVVDSGIRALEVLEARHDFALLFTDIKMPGMSGLELAERVQRDYPNIAVLLTSGFAAELDGRDGLDLLAKPYTPNVLIARVRAALASHRNLGANDGARWAK